MEKSSTKCCWETILRPFSKKIKIDHISGSIVSRFIQSVFIICQVEGYGKMLKLRCRLLAFTSYKAFSKNKKRSGSSLPTPIFCIISKKECFSFYFLLTNQFHCLIAWFLRYWVLFEIWLFSDVINFEIKIVCRVWETYFQYLNHYFSQFFYVNH